VKTLWQYQRKEQVHQHRHTEEQTGKQQYPQRQYAKIAAQQYYPIQFALNADNTKGLLQVKKRQLQLKQQRKNSRI
jgi:hypothetical protein